MYGIRNTLQHAPIDTLHSLSQIGYSCFEPCVLLEELRGKYGLWGQQDLLESIPHLAKAGLEIPSCHIFCSDWANAENHLLPILQATEIPQFVVNFPKRLDAASCTHFAELCSKLGSWLESHNRKLLLHNNAEEIIFKIDGLCAYEWVLQSCHGHAAAQPDVGWLLSGSYDPLLFLAQHQDCIASLHVKDMNQSRQEAEIGQGILNLPSLISFARGRSIPLIIDQDISYENDNACLSSIERAFQSITQPTI